MVKEPSPDPPLPCPDRTLGEKELNEAFEGSYFRDSGKNELRIKKLRILR